MSLTSSPLPHSLWHTLRSRGEDKFITKLWEDRESINRKSQGSKLDPESALGTGLERATHSEQLGVEKLGKEALDLDI